MTAQIEERLIIDGEETLMAFCPPLPFGHPRLYEVSDEDQNYQFCHTACWRRYQGTWEIKDGRFLQT
jgi:hypothetical protein